MQRDSRIDEGFDGSSPSGEDLVKVTDKPAGHRRIKLRVFVFCLLVLLLIGALTAVAVYGAWKDGRFLPAWITWQHSEYASDLNGDGYLEALRLENRHLSIYEDGALACETPDDWFVSDVFTGDLDSDGVMELICLTWKQGSYGPSKPFWVEKDTRDFSQHIFIFHYADGQLEQVWLSSDLGMEVDEMSLDANQRFHLHTRSSEDHTLEWQEWGLIFLDDANPSMREADYAMTDVLAVGDNIAHSGILNEARQGDGSYDFSPLYENVTGTLVGADTAVIMQETAFTEDEAQISGEFPLFATPPAMGDALTEAGFDVVCAATNHVGDAGVTGITDTLEYWQDTNPEVTLLGLNASPDIAGAPVYREVNGVRMALFDYCFGLNDTATLAPEEEWRVDLLEEGAASTSLLAGLQAAEGEADISICFLHIGEEYAEEPGVDEEALIEQVIDAGADAVICSHPHVVQRTQTVTTQQGNSAIVCYSLGNFVSNQPFPATVLGAAVELAIEKPLYLEGKEGSDAPEPTRIAGVKVIPTVCHVGDGHTRVYLLEDYSEALAEDHYVNDIEKGSVSLASLEEQWLALTKHE